VAHAATQVAEIGERDLHITRRIGKRPILGVYGVDQRVELLPEPTVESLAPGFGRARRLELPAMIAARRLDAAHEIHADRLDFFAVPNLIERVLFLIADRDRILAAETHISMRRHAQRDEGRDAEH
jgi:hypothetical protein